ncbi:hypothetical protein ACM66B_001005 [Microbotryomycetes sp. NB124-2]
MAFKRALTVEDDDDGLDLAFSPSPSLPADDQGPSQSKKQKPTSSNRRLTAAEREQRKEERMERNRRAAQASRDRKKAQQDHLEARIAELEEQLAAALAKGHAPHAPVVVDVSPSLGGDDHVSRLEQENSTLRLQLQSERAESAALKARLGSLEHKFSRLEDLLKGDHAVSTTAAQSPIARPVLPSPAPSIPFSFDLDQSTPLLDASSLFPSLPSILPALPSFESTPTTTAVADTSMMPITTSSHVQEYGAFDSSRLVAREVESLPRKLSSHLSRKTSTTSSLIINNSNRPTLHQVLASIQVPLLRSSLTSSPSNTLGTTGPRPSATLIRTRRSTCPLQVFLLSNSTLTTRSLGSTLKLVRRQQPRRPTCSRSFKQDRRASSAKRR